MKYSITLAVSLAIGAVFTAVVYFSPSEYSPTVKVAAAWALATFTTLGLLSQMDDQGKR